MRQIRLAQGVNANRVERVWLVVGAASPAREILEEYEGTRVLRILGRRLPGEPPDFGPGNHIYVIDPLGNLMMQFPREPDPRRMVKDLARLLKASRIG